MHITLLIEPALAGFLVSTLWIFAFMALSLVLKTWWTRLPNGWVPALLPTFSRFNLLILTLLLASFATGYSFNTAESLRTIILGVLGSSLCLLASALWSSKLSRLWFGIYVLTSVLYFPVGWMYGAPTFKIVGGMLEADSGEVWEFLSFVPSYVWGLQLLYAVFVCLSWRTVLPLFEVARGLSGRYRRYLVMVALMIVFLPILGKMAITDNVENVQDYEALTPVPMVGFYIDLVSAPYVYWQKKSALIEQAKLPATWHIHSVRPKYKNYVLVIGESARADYLHAYGFKLQNTPFLSNSKALLLDGYLSTAEFTMASLPQTLSLKKANFSEIEELWGQSHENHNNIISLAEMAGFETAWLSNQGMLGMFANETSTYAHRADFTYFTQRGDYQNSSFLHDSMLLPQLEKVLQKPSDTPRLIVLHLMGSHHDFCKRLEQAPSFEYQSEKLSCYVSTIKQTDDLLRDAVGMLEAKGEPYSLVYFSDHGLKHLGTGSDEMTLSHGGDTYESFYVPLVKISSDDVVQRKIKTNRSAFYFLTGFADWLGIDVEEVRREGYDFWGEQDDVPAKDNNLEQVLSLPRDPPP